MICYLPISGTSYWLDRPLVCCSMAILVPFSFNLKMVETEKNLNFCIFFSFKNRSENKIIQFFSQATKLFLIYNSCAPG